MPTVYNALKSRCTPILFARNLERKKKEARLNTHTHRHTHTHTQTACSDRIKIPGSRAYVAYIETPICGRHLWRWPLRQRHLAGPAISSSAGNPTHGRSRAVAAVCARTRICVDSSTAAVAAIRAMPHAIDSGLCEKVRGRRLVFDVCAGCLGPINYAIPFCHLMPRNMKPPRASNQLKWLGEWAWTPARACSLSRVHESEVSVLRVFRNSGA